MTTVGNATAEGPFELNWHQGRLYDGSVVIQISGDRDEYLKEFRQVDQAGTIDTP